MTIEDRQEVAYLIADMAVKKRAIRAATVRCDYADDHVAIDVETTDGHGYILTVNERH